MTKDPATKVVVITGTTSGTGFVCAREMAKLGATVVLLNRQSQRSDTSLQQLKDTLPDGKFDAITCDLQDFESVRKAINDIKDRYNVVDVLCNNAGVMALEDRATKDGYDIPLTRAVSDRVAIPVIASGGVGNLEHIREGLVEGGASAALAASIFHFREYTIGECKEYLNEKGVAVRPQQQS